MSWQDTQLGWSYNFDNGDIRMADGSTPTLDTMFNVGTNYQGFNPEEGRYLPTWDTAQAKATDIKYSGDNWMYGNQALGGGLGSWQQALADWGKMMQARQIASQASSPQDAFAQLNQFNQGSMGSFLNAGIVDPSTDLGGGMTAGDMVAKQQAAAKSDMLGDMFDFEGFHLEEYIKNFAENPELLLLAPAQEQFSTELAEEITGNDYTATHDQIGRPSEETYQGAQERGIDTFGSEGVHTLAGGIATTLAGGYLANALGAGSAAGSEMGPYGGMDQAAVAGADYGNIGSSMFVDPSTLQPTAQASTPTMTDAGMNPAHSPFTGPQTPTGYGPTDPVMSTVSQPVDPFNLAPNTYGTGASTVPSTQLGTGPAATQIPTSVLTGAGAGAATGIAQGVAQGATDAATTPNTTTTPNTNDPFLELPGDQDIPAGFWESLSQNPIFQGMGSAFGSLFNSQNTMDLGLGLLNYHGLEQFRKGTLDLMNKAVDRADPFHSQRGFYQDQYKNMNTNPNWLNEDPALQAIQNNAMRNVSSQNAAKGYLNSGNILHDLTRTGTETAANYAMPRMDLAARSAGAFVDPSAAGQLMGNLGNMANTAGIQQNQVIGNTAQKVFGQNGSGGNNFMNMLGGLFSSAK